MKNKKIVTIGGGTGSFVLLSGISNYPVQISAVVSMADDGGSTGVLRDELGVLPPGDVRQCLVALSESSEKLRELMNYRFEKGNLKGHSFGNIFLSALEKIQGSFESGVEEASKILNVRGRVIPVTEKDTNLIMKLKNGKILQGEDEINHNYEIEKQGISKFYLSPKAQANKSAIKSILEADLIIIGPGNHFCSILPNFLVKGVSEAIRKSKAKIIYNANLVNKKGHSDNFLLEDYVKSVEDYIGKNRIDFVIFNTQKPKERLIEKYQKKGETLLKMGKENVRRSYKIVKADVLNEKFPKFSKVDSISEVRSFIRHDSEKLARVLMMILESSEYKNLIKEII